MVSKSKKTILILSIALVAVVLAAVGTSYALFRYKVIDGDKFKIMTGHLELSLSDDVANAEVVVNNLMPMTEEIGMAQEGYSFRLTNTGSINSVFTVYIDDVVPSSVSGDRIPNNLMRAGLTNKTTGRTYVTKLDESRIFETSMLEPNESNEYELRLWLDESATSEQENKYYAVKIRVDGAQENAVKPLNELILGLTKVNSSEPSIDSSSKIANENGLYKVSVTNGFGGTDGDTYVFRGFGVNNYVSFAGYLWRIVRINEDGTTRLMLENGISNDYTFFSEEGPEYNGYYSNSTIAKPLVDSWYQNNIVKLGYDNEVAEGNYFCQQAKVMWENNHIISSPVGTADMVYKEDYVPSLTCETDNNGYGLLNGKVGLITYDEVVYAGGNFPFAYSIMDFYMMTNEDHTFTMSNGGYDDTNQVEWLLHSDGRLETCPLGSDFICKSSLRPVINLKTTTKVWGHGTLADPYKVVIDTN